MDYKIAIYSLDSHCLQIPVPESEMLHLYKSIVAGLKEAKKKGLFYEYEHNDHPFLCHPEHVQSVTIMRTQTPVIETDEIAKVE